MGKARQQLDKQWKEVLEKNYQKSLDHRSFYFKTHERKAVMSKTLLQEAKVAKRRADAKKSKNGMASPKVGPVSGAVTTTGVTVADVGGPNPTKPSDASPNKQIAVATSAEGAAIVASSPLTFAMPDVEAHRDVGLLCNLLQTKRVDLDRRHDLPQKRVVKTHPIYREIIHPLQG